MLFDTIVIGGGQGAALARMLAQGGQRVALIEKNSLGGTCTNVGCTPSKAQIAAAKRASDARNARKLGVKVGEVRAERDEIANRSNAIVREFRGYIEERLDSIANLQIFRGHGRFRAAKTLEVALENGELCEIQAQNIVLAVGSATPCPALDGIENVEWLDHARALQLREIPRHLAILGGGYIACEFAQMWARFGARVTIIQNGDHLLSREDPCVSDAIAQILRDENIEIRLGCEAQNVRKIGEEIEIHLKNSPAIRPSHLLVATGQKPNTNDLNLGKSGVKTGENGEILTDEFLEAAPNVFALGDCKGGPAFKHIAFDDARILSARLLRGEKRSIQNRLVSYVVYTDPQLGRVGMTAAQAREKNLDFEEKFLPICDTARGVESGEDKGFLRALVERGSGKILGGAFLARDGGELISVLQTAMLAELPAQALRDATFPHPTQAEALNRLFSDN